MEEMAELYEYYADGDDAYFPELEHGFWRDKNNKLHRLVDMETSHLKNIVRLLNKNCLETPDEIELELEFREQRAREIEG